MKLGALIRATEKRLRAAPLHYGHGTDNPRDEAAFLVLRGLGLSFDADPMQEVDPRHVEPLVRARIEKRLPAAYVLKEAWLAGVPFYVDRRVIVPRSHIAAMLADRLHPWRRRPVRTLLDLCTGSGCLAVLGALAFPRARVEGSDISRAALSVAAINVKRHRLSRRIRLTHSDLFAKLQGRRYDVIVCNPPYVDEPAMRRLPAEYRHEPLRALAGGKLGVDLVGRILAAAPAHLERGGLLFCEVGDRKKAVERAFPSAPLLWPQPEVFILEA